MQNSLSFAKEHLCIAGVDEAGRGALIGNVVAAAVILPTEFEQERVVDSKSLSEIDRESNAEYVRSIALDYAIGTASSVEIDELNIHHATLLAMKRAIDGLSCHFDEVWVDGKFVPACHKPATAFVKGDSLYPCISAASLLAKTYRDAELRLLDKHFPQYGFAKHKGYPTQAHRQALEKYGVLAEHRRSYKTIKCLLDREPH